MNKQFKNHISQYKIAKNVGPSPSTIHNIVKRFRESREISVNRARKPLLNVLDLRTLRWHCLRNIMLYCVKNSHMEVVQKDDIYLSKIRMIACKKGYHSVLAKDRPTSD